MVGPDDLVEVVVEERVQNGLVGNLDVEEIGWHFSDTVHYFRVLVLGCLTELFLGSDRKDGGDGLVTGDQHHIGDFVSQLSHRHAFLFEKVDPDLQGLDILDRLFILKDVPVVPVGLGRLLVQTKDEPWLRLFYLHHSEVLPQRFYHIFGFGVLGSGIGHVDDVGCHFFVEC